MRNGDIRGIKWNEPYPQKQFGECNMGQIYDKILKGYTKLPNETLYLVDYSTLQFEPLCGNFQKITGIDLPHKNEVPNLYEHVHASQLEVIHTIYRKVLDLFVYSPNVFEIEKDSVFTCYKTFDNRIILKCSFPIYYDSFKKMRFSVGKLMDVTDLIPFHHFSYKFEGPNKDFLYDYFDVDDNNSPFTKREREILELVGKKWSSDKIAKHLFISRLTVEKHRRNIIKKVDATSTLEAYYKAKNLGII